MDVIPAGPLGPHVAGFGQWLATQGYGPVQTARQLEFVAQLSRWLEQARPGSTVFTRNQLAQYVAVRHADACATLHSPRALRPLLRYLEGLGVLACAPVAAPETPHEELVAAFCRFLRDERGLAAFTVGRYAYWVRQFMASGTPVGAGLRPAHVQDYLLRRTKELSVPAAKQLVSALRALLRFLAASGIVEAGLPGAVPGVAGWSMSHLPRGLRPDDVARLLGACDRSAPTGMRDRAVLVLMARLGLRAGEVAALALDDVDWRRGELVVRGKGRRQERLPMPADVGGVLAAYLRHGRPTGTGHRFVFLTVHAPRAGLGRGAVGSIVVRAGRAAGVEGASAHRLRHSAATELLAKGASLTEVGQVLRHASVSSTAIYAKVDHTALGELIRPWPQRAS